MARIYTEQSPTFNPSVMVDDPVARQESLYDHQAQQMEATIARLTEAIGNLRARLTPVTDPSAFPFDAKEQMARIESAPLIAQLAYWQDALDSLTEHVETATHQLVI